MNMKHWCNKSLRSGLCLPLVAAAAALKLLGADAPALAPLPLKLPIPAFMGTPTDTSNLDTNKIEKMPEKPRAPFMAPAGVQNVAAQKKVTSSDKSPITGTLDLVTDGDKESNDNSFMELHRKLQWVQLDLEKPCKIYAILVWHAHNTFQVYHSVIVQVSDDPDFTKDVQTLFNNDQDNSAGLGVGTDKEYWENYEGRLVDAKGVAARYVRCYSKGSSYSALNRYTEIEVWGLPAQ